MYREAQFSLGFFRSVWLAMDHNMYNAALWTMETDPDEIVRRIAELPRKQQLELVLAVLSRLSLTWDGIAMPAKAAPMDAFGLPERPRLRQALATLTGPDAALVAALAHVADQPRSDVQFGTEELNAVLGEARRRKLNVHDLSPLCVDQYLAPVPSASGGRKRFQFTALGLEKAKLVSRKIFEGEELPD